MITASAIFYIPTQTIYTGFRHSDILNRPRPVSFKAQDGNRVAIQGFITDKAEFLDRKQAYKHAKKCGQIKKEGIIGKILTSEDLW